MLSMEKIIKNAIKCNHCGDVIESVHVHDFVSCSCGCCAVDGGKCYLRRTFRNSRDDFTDLSEVIETDEDYTRSEPSPQDIFIW